MLRGAITTSVATGTGRGGDIDVDSRFVVLNKSRIIARADQGDGGNISISAGTFLPSGDSIVDASSRLGISGTIQTTSPDTALTSGITPLPATFVDASALLQDHCAARTARAGSLVVRGRDRLPPPPDAPLRGFYPGGSPDPTRRTR